MKKRKIPSIKKDMLFKICTIVLVVIMFGLFGIKQHKYIVGKDATCVGLAETSSEKVFCKDKHNKPINGKIIEYFENGKIAKEIELKRGYEHGVEKEYYDTGILKASAMIKHGKPYGISRLYHKNGQLYMEMKWKKDGADIVRIYDENGTLIHILKK